MRGVDIHHHLATFKIIQCLAHLAGTIKIVEPVRTFFHTGNVLRHEAGAGRNHQIIITKGLARFRGYLFGFHVYIGCRVNKKSHPLVDYLALVSEQFGFTDTAEGDVEQTGLIHMFVRITQHGNTDRARF